MIHGYGLGKVESELSWWAIWIVPTHKCEIDAVNAIQSLNNLIEISTSVVVNYDSINTMYPVMPNAPILNPLYFVILLHRSQCDWNTFVRVPVGQTDRLCHLELIKRELQVNLGIFDVGATKLYSYNGHALWSIWFQHRELQDSISRNYVSKRAQIKKRRTEAKKLSLGWRQHNVMEYSALVASGHLCLGQPVRWIDRPLDSGFGWNQDGLRCVDDDLSSESTSS